MKIWVHRNGVQEGPYDLPDLLNLGIDASTPVWYQGLAQWMPAGLAPMTAPFFVPTAAPQPQSQPQPQPQQIFVQQMRRPSTYMAWSILLTILCCSPFAIAAIVTGAISASRYNTGDYPGAQTMSDITAWLLILTIVLSPFTMFFIGGLWF